jgi:hypothetical protein
VNITEDSLAERIIFHLLIFDGWITSKSQFKAWFSGLFGGTTLKDHLKKIKIFAARIFVPAQRENHFRCFFKFCRFALNFLAWIQK